jgi:hypothetical protein
MAASGAAVSGHLQLDLVEDGQRLGLFVRLGPPGLRHDDLTRDSRPFNQYPVSAVVVVQTAQGHLDGCAALQPARVEAKEEREGGLGFGGRMQSAKCKVQNAKCKRAGGFHGVLRRWMVMTALYAGDRLAVNER